ncbi:ribonuclease I [Acinetobacter sp. NCu2D-2]|uniref:ribonuclease T2 family protein n=1 Tax=Acinetobacter sp. NCu2D-2 TaxID=1608473 RepID=UPI0007CDA1C9|nr:ribonuclease I [Acinetobacter sp. NCu2D-2]ANF82531.1 ribonuclease I [Acinetobacter sp. NCu2D-2]
MGVMSNRLLVVASVLLAGAGNTVSAATPNYIMDVQLVPAVCSLHADFSKKRKCLEGYSLNIAGLYPEHPSGDCTTTSSAKLSPLQSKVVARVMPDEQSRTLLWRNIGGCMPMNATQYFRNIINYAAHLKVPEELTGQENIVMPIESLRSKFLKINPGLPSHGVKFSCQKVAKGSLLTSIKICYYHNGKYKQCPSNVINTCAHNVLIKGTY